MVPMLAGRWEAPAQVSPEPTDPVSDVGRVVLREAD